MRPRGLGDRESSRKYDAAAEAGERWPLASPLGSLGSGFLLGRDAAANGIPTFGVTAAIPLARRRLATDLGLRLLARARFSRSESESFSSVIEEGEAIRLETAERVIGAK